MTKEEASNGLAKETTPKVGKEIQRNGSVAVL